MASNRIPDSYTEALALGEDAADGAQEHGAAIGLLQNTETSIRADIAALIAAQDNSSQMRAGKALASSQHKTADSNGKAYIALFIQLESPRLGTSWGPLWQEAGFTAGSISNPGTQDGRFILLGKLALFLTNHPEYHVIDPARPELTLTPATAQARYDAISDARAILNNASAENGSVLAVRNDKLAALRARLTGLREELTQIPLPGDSPLWYAFGFNRPDDPSTPGIPELLVLTPGAAGSGILIADWASARRATGYRVKIQVAGEAEPRLFGLFEDDQAAIPGLPPGLPLTVTIIAHNEAGDSAESAPATITLS